MQATCIREIAAHLYYVYTQEHTGLLQELTVVKMPQRIAFFID